MYYYIEAKYKDSIEHCFHFQRYIICSRSHITNYEQCLFKSVYSKFKVSIKRLDDPKVLRIRRQQTLIRN